MLERDPPRTHRHRILICFCTAICWVGFVWVGQARAQGAVNHILATGQSLSAGADGCPALTTDDHTISYTVTDQYNNLLSAFAPLMENKLRPCRTPADPQGLLDKPVETPYSAMTRTIAALVGSPGYRQYSVGMHGGTGVHGGPPLPYVALKKGTPPYEKGLEQVRAAKTFATDLSRPFRVVATTVVHGESDHNGGTPPLEYEYDMQEWQKDYEADARALTGQSDAVPLFLTQMSSFTTYGAETSLIPEAQLKAAQNNPGKVYLVGPKYMLDYRKDGGSVSAHLLNKGYRQLGEYYGKVIAQVLAKKRNWRPLSPRSIDISSTTVTLKLYVPSPPIKIDTHLVSAALNYGFEVTDGTTSPPLITAVSIAGPGAIVIKLNRPPTPGADTRLRYAYTGKRGSIPGRDRPGSARGNIRDSDPTTSLYGNKLFNWLVQFDEPIPYFGLHMTRNTCIEGSSAIGWGWNIPPTNLTFHFTRRDEETKTTQGMPLDASIGHFESFSRSGHKYIFSVTARKKGKLYGKNSLVYITQNCG